MDHRFLNSSPVDPPQCPGCRLPLRATLPAWARVIGAVTLLGFATAALTALLCWPEHTLLIANFILAGALLLGITIALLNRAVVLHCPRRRNHARCVSQNQPDNSAKVRR